MSNQHQQRTQNGPKSTGQGPAARNASEVTLKVQRGDNPFKQKNERFICNVRFTNTLPEIPCDPKMLLPPLDPHQISAFSLTSTEKELKRGMLFPPDLGIPVNALNIERFSIPETRVDMDPADAALLKDLNGGEEEATRRRPGVHSGRRRDAAGDVTWLMRTKYITNDAEARKGKIKAEEAEEEALAPEELLSAQIEAIEASFAAAGKIPVHPRNPDAKPLEVLPVLPDEFLNGWPCVMANFDGDPIADVEKMASLPAEERARSEQAAQLKSFVRRRPDGSVDRFVAFMLPRAPPPAAHGDAAQDGVVAVTASDLCGDYDWIREYDSVVRYDERGQTFLFRVAKDHVGYSDLNTKVALRKRKRGASSQQRDDEEDEEAFLQPEKFILTLPGVAAEIEAEIDAGAGGEEGVEQGAAAQVEPEDGAAMEVDKGEENGGDGNPGNDTNPNTAALMRDVFGSDDDD